MSFATSRQPKDSRGVQHSEKLTVPSHFDSYCVLQVSFDSILRNMSSDVGVVMGATVPNGVGTAWVISKQHHPYMEFALRRLPSENRW